MTRVLICCFGKGFNMSLQRVSGLQKTEKKGWCCRWYVKGEVAVFIVCGSMRVEEH
ncbi:hypothetical protein POPTR_019G036450v4 [Populus trichocarpa]|uniref:Uncharacterized protein n=1 Tax=Populus trichocarpa TaxID=3694 RepID=A0ACC0RKX8_POPTR|nr:hypothetical protein POPTR_019G036450v4 [Populus trichocarpa]